MPQLGAAVSIASLLLGMQLGLPLTCWAAEDAAPHVARHQRAHIEPCVLVGAGRGDNLTLRSVVQTRGRLSAAPRGRRLRVVDHFHSVGRRVLVAFSSFALGACAARVGAAAVFPLIRGQDDEPVPVTHAGRPRHGCYYLGRSACTEGGPPGHRGDALDVLPSRLSARRGAQLLGGVRVSARRPVNRVESGKFFQFLRREPIGG